jgi:hypothetical protein
MIWTTITTISMTSTLTTLTMPVLSIISITTFQFTKETTVRVKERSNRLMELD